ncbi:MAG: serine/threonine protein kinase [Candidatus Xenobiia bacterium LiM19]
MGYRDSAPDCRKDKEGHSILVLPQGTSLAGKYQVSYLGIGGMSIVYKGSRDGKTYFIKEVCANNSQHVISLSQEKFMLERLRHPAIVKIHDFFEHEGFCYLVTDFIEGRSLNRLISPIPDIFIQEKVVLDWARQLYDIFDYLHSQKPPIIYRDLKPQNVIRDNEGKIHLVDFGIARIYKEDSIGDTTPMGSFLTASPEHYGMKQTTERSDIYTLGATLHYLLTNGKGRGSDIFDFAAPRNINPKISEKTERVIMKALSPEPEKRFSSIEEMRRAHFNSVSSENTKAVPTPANDEETLKLTQSGQSTREGSPGKGEKPGSADSESMLQSFISFTLSQPRFIAIFLTLLVLVTFTAVVLRGSGKPKITALSSPEVTLSAESTAAMYTGTSPEPGASPSSSPLVPEPGYNIIIGTSTPTAKATPTVVAATQSSAPTITSQPAYPVTTVTPRQNITVNPHSAPTQEPPKSNVTENPPIPPAPSTKEEIFARIFSVKKETIKPFDSSIYFDINGRYSLKIPSGYYKIGDSGSTRFVNIDSNLEMDSLRMFSITTNTYKDVTHVPAETAIASWAAAKVNEGATILEQNTVKKLGARRTSIIGFYLTYQLDAPHSLQKFINSQFIYKDCFLQNVSDLVFHFTASAPEKTYTKYLDSEIQPFFDSIYLKD